MCRHFSILLVQKVSSTRQPRLPLFWYGYTQEIAAIQSAKRYISLYILDILAYILRYRRWKTNGAVLLEGAYYGTRIDGGGNAYLFAFFLNSDDRAATLNADDLDTGIPKRSRALWSGRERMNHRSQRRSRNCSNRGLSLCCFQLSRVVTGDTGIRSGINTEPGDGINQKFFLK